MAFEGSGRVYLAAVALATAGAVPGACRQVAGRQAGLP